MDAADTVGISLLFYSDLLYSIGISTSSTLFSDWAGFLSVLYLISYVVSWDFAGGRRVPLFPSACREDPQQVNADKYEWRERSPFQALTVNWLWWLLHVQVWYQTSSHSSSVLCSNCSRSALNKWKRLKCSAIAVMEVTCVPTWSLKQTFWLKQIWRNHHLPC